MFACVSDSLAGGDPQRPIHPPLVPGENTPEVVQAVAWLLWLSDCGVLQPLAKLIYGRVQ